jgi:hypothetical protein
MTISSELCHIPQGDKSSEADHYHLRPSRCGACRLQQEPGAAIRLHSYPRRGLDYATPYHSNGYPDGSDRRSCR